MPRHWLSTFESDLPRLCADLKDLVLLESPTADAALVSRLGEWIHDRLRERGVPAELRHCPPAGNAVLASAAYRDGGDASPGPPRHGLAGARPMRRNALDAPGRSGLRSGGIFDMKAGIAVGMAVLTAMLRETDPSPVSLLLVPDEETGSTHSRELSAERGPAPSPGAGARAFEGRRGKGGAQGQRCLSGALRGSRRPRRARARARRFGAGGAGAVHAVSRRPGRLAEGDDAHSEPGPGRGRRKRRSGVRGADGRRPGLDASGGRPRERRAFEATIRPTPP